MNSLALVSPCTPSYPAHFRFHRVHRGVRRAIWGVSVCLVALGLMLLSPAARAQSDAEDEPLHSIDVPQDQTAEEPGATAKQYFVITDATITLPAEHSTGGAPIKTTSHHYQGTVDYACELLTGPATDTPAECGLLPASAKLLVNGTVSPSMLVYGKGTKVPSYITPGGTAWMRVAAGAGGTALACCLLFGVPARRRAWRNVLSALLMLAAMGSLSACVTPAKMITQGKYLFKVTGKDSVNPDLNAIGYIVVNVL